MEERKRTGKWWTCEVCGHEWYSYSYQEKVSCPKCSERRSGKRRGPKKDNPEIPATNPPEKTIKKAEQTEETNKKGGFLEGFLNKKIF